MSDTLIFVLEIIGTVAFAISGAAVGINKRMDAFGVLILGLTTAVGGGAIRDVILGINPPNTFRNPVYAVVALISSIIIFLPFVRRFLGRSVSLYNALLLISDSLGLGIFTVVGIRTAYNVSNGFNAFLLLFVGVITGVGGGILRDVMAMETPGVFTKHFYACASLIGGFVTIILWELMGEFAGMMVGASVTFVLRMLASYYHWELPRAVPDNELDK